MFSPSERLVVCGADEHLVRVGPGHLLDRPRVPRDGRLGLLVLLEVKDPDQLVVRARGQRLGVVAKVDGLDDVFVGQRELLLARRGVPNLKERASRFRK